MPYAALAQAFIVAKRDHFSAAASHDHHGPDHTCGARLKPFSNNYAEQSEYYRRANVAQRIIMEDRFYWLTMKLLGKIIGPFEGSGTGKGLIQRAAWEHEEKRKSQPIRFGRRAINRRKEVSY